MPPGSSFKKLRHYIIPGEFYSNQPTNGEHPDAEIIIAAPNKFSKDHVLDKYGAAIKAAAAQLLGSTNILVVIKVDIQEENKVAVSTAKPPLRKAPTPVKQSHDNFARNKFKPAFQFF